MSDFNSVIAAIAPARMTDTSRMKPAASRTVSRIMPINAKNAALLRVMVEIIPPLEIARPARAGSVGSPAYGILTHPRGFVGSPVYRHAVLKYCSGPKLSFLERRGDAVIAVIGGPVEVAMVVLLRDRILCPIPRNVDKCECLAHGQSHFPLGTRMPFISARAVLPLSRARVWSLCRIAITIVLTCGMARFSLS